MGTLDLKLSVLQKSALSVARCIVQKAPTSDCFYAKKSQCFLELRTSDQERERRRRAELY